MPPKGYTKKERGLFWNLGDMLIDPNTGQEKEGGEMVIGIWGEYVESDEVSFSNDNVGRYRIKLEGFATEQAEFDNDLNGATVTILGSTLLDEFFNSEEDPIEVGTDVWIQFTGMGKTKSGNRPLKRFDVSVKE